MRDISRDEMDGLLFRTVANQEKLLIDNACVVYQYNEVTVLVTYEYLYVLCLLCWC